MVQTANTITIISNESRGMKAQECGRNTVKMLKKRHQLMTVYSQRTTGPMFLS